MTKLDKSNWQRPVDRLDLAIAGTVLFIMLSLATLAAAGIISEKWIPRFLLGSFVACVGLYVVCVLLIRAHRRRRSNVPDNPPMQRTGGNDNL